MSKETMTIDEFSEEFKKSYNAFYTALKSLINRKFKNIDTDSVMKPYEDSVIDMNFKDPESGQTGKVVAVKLIDVPFMSLATFDEQSNGKIENINQFLARINISFTNQIISTAKEILETLENKKDYRLFSKFTSKTQDGSFELYLIYNGVQETVNENTMIIKYNRVLFESAEIGDTTPINPKEFQKFDFKLAYKVPVSEVVQNNGPDYIKTRLEKLYTDKFVAADEKIYDELKKKFIQSKNNFKRATADLLTDRDEVRSAILKRINKICEGVTTRLTKDNTSISTMIVTPLVFTYNKNVYIAIGSMVDNKFVILEIDAIFVYIKNGKLNTMYYPVLITECGDNAAKFYKLRASFPVVEYWKALGYIHADKDITPSQTLTSTIEDFDVWDCGSPNVIDTSTHQETPKLWQDTPEYIKNDLVEVSSRLNSTVHGLNNIAGKSMSFEKITNPRVAADKVTLGVLHGLDAEKTDPTYLSIENAVELIKTRSGVLEDIKLECTKTHIVGQGSIKFIGILKK